MQMPRWMWWSGLGLTALMVVGICFWRLNIQPIQNWDESIHAAVSHESLERASWADLWYRDGHYFRKPPLKFWLTSLGFAIFGESPWTVRGWSALAGMVTSVLLGWWAWQLWKNRWLALLTVLVFISGRFVFFHSFRTGETDGLLMLFITGALYSYWRSWLRPRWILWTSFFTALGVMTKSAGGLLPVIVIAVDLIVQRRWPFRWRDLLWALGIFVAVVAPWHILESFRYGATFWKDYLGVHVLERATEQIHNQDVGLFWYAEIFIKRFYPWSLWLPFALVAAFQKVRRQPQSPARLFLIWFVVTFIFFTLVQTKFDWYILPLYPAAALLLAPWLATLLRYTNRWILGAHALSFFVYLLMLPGAIHPASVLRWIYPFTFLTETSPTALYTGLMVVVIAVYLWLMTRTKPHWLPRLTGIYGLGKMLLLAVGFSLLTIRAQTVDSPFPELVGSVKTSGATTLYTKGIDLLNYPAAYYYFRTIPNVRLIDLQKNPAPAVFGAKEVIIVRDPATPPTGLQEKTRVKDFRLLTP